MVDSLKSWVTASMAAGAIGVALIASGCAGDKPVPDLAAIYGQAAREIGDERVPVVVLPGILGSKLERASSGKKVWGSFTFGASDADRPEGARELALPMAMGVPLSKLRDDTVATDVLDVVVADVAIFRGLEIGAYVDILRTLAAGRYRDQMLGESGAIDYGGAHYTCFQYAYDWRRDIAEQAVYLNQLILTARETVRQAKGLPPSADVKVDVVAHSMGGMVLRYYLRYGTQPLPEDGSLPELTWAGARHIDKAILIGTPSGGSVLSLQQLVRGWDLNPLFPNYRASLLGTMPAIYQLLPRERHARVVHAETGEPIALYDPQTWIDLEWGLADPDEARILEWLIPDVDDPEERRRIAIDHLTKCLAKAEQLHRALDVPAQLPDGLELMLFAGDAEDTPSAVTVESDGSFEIAEFAPGDNTVTRASALMDERLGSAFTPKLRTPVPWSRVQFISADHLGLTKVPEFADNLLYELLEDPRTR
ncbi:MAG: hypothetical protein AAGB51_09175 [Planctomycetota bacterium]